MKEAFGLVFLAVFIAGVIGWLMNVAGLFDCDFEAPYKCEIVRGVGVVIPPVGAIAGYIDLGK